MTRISLAFALAAATVTLGIPSNALSDETNNQAQLTTMPSVPDGMVAGQELGRAPAEKCTLKT